MKKYFIAMFMLTYVTTFYIRAQVPIGAATNVARPANKDTVRPHATIPITVPSSTQNNSQNPNEMLP